MIQLYRKQKQLNSKISSMNLSKYEYSTDESLLDYEFDSEGPNGKIRKVVRYSPQNANGITYFNLAFGDFNKVTGRIDDLTISNNQDRDKILATVASTVLAFTEYFPDAMVFATGSTLARTRLYQMGIGANWEQIESVLEVFGFVKGNWESFARNINYEAFIVKRKKP